MTPARGDIVSEEIDNYFKSEWDLKDDGVVLAQPSVDGPVVPLALSGDDPPVHDAPNSIAPNASNSPA